MHHDRTHSSQQNETNKTKQVSCDELSEEDFQSFAVIANGEFIKTNALPTTPDPSDWLDLVDQAADNILTWKFGAVLAVSIFVCCIATYLCRRCDRSRKHRSKVNRYRRDITANRGAPGRKLRPTNVVRPQPYEGPMRHPGEMHVAGSTRFQEPWRRPGPGSVGGRSMRSMRSERSARGALLTGAGAVVPGQFTEDATPQPTEACPECGLRLPDAVQLVQHVQIQHGGRANRNAQVVTAQAVVSTSRAATAGQKVVVAKPVSSSSNGATVVVVKAPVKVSPLPMSGNPYADARAVGATAQAKPASAPKPVPRFNSPSRGTGSRDRHASSVQRATAVENAGAGATAASRARGRAASPTRVRSNSPGTSGNSSHSGGGSGSGRSGSGPSTSTSASSRSGGRDALPRIRDLGGPGRSGNQPRSPLPRIFSHRGDRRGGSGETSRGRTSAVAGAVAPGRATGKSSPPSSLPPLLAGVTNSSDSGSGSGSGSGGGGGGRRKSQSREGGDRGSGERGRGRNQGRGRDREPAPGFEGSNTRGPVKEDPRRSYTRTSSLDRMSALSSRSITHQPDSDIDMEGAANAGGSAGKGNGKDGAGREAERVKIIAQRRVRRNASTDDHVPKGKRLTVDNLKKLGSGLDEVLEVPPPVFSPVKPKGKEPAYSPVAWERAGELDEERPVSLTRKFFRQLSK